MLASRRKCRLSARTFAQLGLVRGPGGVPTIQMRDTSILLALGISGSRLDIP